ncbi:hypothetical protein [Paenibacillus pini]|uniref:Uncharacterized protein n=1 Tax=Paenibacillus pini JCM 16418 TaxID=1236976 RepID=W7YXQ4_9BACL|nr:hypothetical protein [Paenibacillus pini]GAF09451.1 hypothetical protein JCM16418_3592 [Paenibacillus pini JCM 16418]
MGRWIVATIAFVTSFFFMHMLVGENDSLSMLVGISLLFASSIVIIMNQYELLGYHRKQERAKMREIRNNLKS